MEQAKQSRIPIAFLAGLGVVLLLLGGLFLVSRVNKPATPAVQPPLPMTPVEQTYAKQIHFLDLKKPVRATNFLNQEVTFLFGTVANEGNRTIREMEVTLEFRDPFNQVVLRDSRRLFGKREAPLGPGQRREFQFGYEHIPDFWNQQFPSMRITGLLLE